MHTVYSPDHLRHDPQRELADGTLVAAVEKPARADIIRARVEAVGLGPVAPPRRFGDNSLMRVHSADYVTFLRGFWDEWTAAGRDGEALPFVWPVRGLRHDVEPRHIDGRLGYYSFDAGSPLTDGTWQAARAAADTALTAAELVCAGETAAFALCRPPGHHAARDYFGGYCYLNNAAIVAEYLLEKGCDRVSILDVDYHHGNGTQSLFAERSDVLFLSLHADPADEFPYFLGYADEIGRGPGEGFTVNYPLPAGTAWAAYAEALDDAIARIKRFGSDVVVVSLGLDTFEKDPISRFRLTSDDFTSLGAALDRIGQPTVFVLEGGYAIDELGVNCVNVLAGFEAAAG